MVADVAWVGADPPGYDHSMLRSPRGVFLLVTGISALTMLVPTSSASAALRGTTAADHVMQDTPPGSAAVTPHVTGNPVAGYGYFPTETFKTTAVRITIPRFRCTGPERMIIESGILGSSVFVQGLLRVSCEGAGVAPQVSAVACNGTGESCNGGFVMPVEVGNTVTIRGTELATSSSVRVVDGTTGDSVGAKAGTSKGEIAGFTMKRLTPTIPAFSNLVFSHLLIDGRPAHGPSPRVWSGGPMTNGRGTVQVACGPLTSGRFTLTFRHS